MIDDGGAAFPAQRDDGWGRPVDNSGMTLRDYFAAAAMNAIISCTPGNARCPPEHATSKRAYEYADAMIEARK